MPDLDALDLDTLRTRFRTTLAAVLVVILFLAGYFAGRESRAPTAPAPPVPAARP